ncbi:Cna B-type domain-containing protein [Cuneatibacter sp. NSJ-177]|uniref:Spy0128 family protein n=1 Tax=Cuneatibacter sp. NSJ-177 TaxID=2931401 RepID=UPI001FD4867D|nr:FctA domain-containing protein [Cuneatibacter sp. NSJ-177]MCJ7834848.1 Cna B-type domain-containing protein [Cuneatibacter sp. NSJ-177]
MSELKKHVYCGIIGLMLCLAGLIALGSGSIVVNAEDGPYDTYVGGKGNTLIFQKQWDDDNDTEGRPEEITFSVYLEDNDRPGGYVGHSKRETISLSAKNNWTYTYTDSGLSYVPNTVKEVNVDGYAYGGVTVDNKYDYSKYEGTVTVTLTNKKQKLEVTSAELGINGIKTLTGREFQIGDKFKFEIRNSANAPANQPLPDKTVCEITPASGNSADIGFGTFTFKNPGTYIYVISEVLPQQGGAEIIPGVTYDTTGYRLTVDVTNDDTAKELKISNVKIESSPRQEAGAWTEIYNGAALPGQQYCNFTNTYTSLEQTISLTGTKVLENKKLADYGNDQFKFIVEAVGRKAADGSYEKDPDQPMPAGSADGVYTCKNLVTGGIVLANNTFTQQHVGKEYRYTIREAQPTADGTFNGAPLEGAYKVDIVTGAPTNEEVTADGTIKWVYKGVTFDNHVHTIDVTAGKVTNDAGQEDIKVSVTHDTHNTSGSAMQNFVFINKYNSDASIALTGTKKLTGRDFAAGDAFTFDIIPMFDAPVPVDGEGNELTQVTIEPTGGTEAAIDFGTLLFDVTDLGTDVDEKIFSYSVSERNGDAEGMTYDSRQRIIQVKVTKGGTGKMSAELVSDQSELIWNNVYQSTPVTPDPDETSLTVKKEWVLNDGGKATDSIKVELLRNGERFDEITLNAHNGWEYTWNDLAGGYRWSVAEVDVPEGFTAEVSNQGNTWIITNDDIPSKPVEPTDPKKPVDDAPKTGDETNLTLWMALFGISGMGVIITLLGSKRKYRGK